MNDISSSAVKYMMLQNEMRYFKLNRILLLILGLWPYQDSKSARLRITLIFSILMSSILFQLRVFMTDDVTSNLIIKVLSATLCHIITGIQYISFWINMKTVRWSIEYLRHICNNLKDENEIAIIEIYSRNMRRYTLGLTLFGVCCMLVLIVGSILGQNNDIFLFTNGSRPYRVWMIIDYFVDRKKNLCMILLHTNVTICIGLTIILATGTMLLGHLQYVCGMFSIASYRISQAINIDQKAQNDINLKNEIMIYKEIICAVDIHRKAMEYSTFLINNFEGTFFFLIILGVTSLSFNLYRIFQITSIEYDVKELLLHLTYLNIILLYMFLSNYIGQQVTDHYNYIFLTA
ncbi:uncharacterized protein LOC105190449 isoform X2 [Harpegnathos saltator]|nr:uncharacterized protein LOC105190449 isoform X2 [Harpegnathos saltator]